MEPTPKGWFIRYIDRSPEALARQQVWFAYLVDMYSPSFAFCCSLPPSLPPPAFSPPSLPPSLPPSSLPPSSHQAVAKKSKMDKDDEERSQKMIQEQIAKAHATKEDSEEVKINTELIYMYVTLYFTCRQNIYNVGFLTIILVYTCYIYTLYAVRLKLGPSITTVQSTALSLHWYLYNRCVGVTRGAYPMFHSEVLIACLHSEA